MVKFSLISLVFGLFISVLCFIVISVNGHPLFLKTIARASSGSSGLNSLNSYSGQSNQNSYNGNTAVNSNPLQGLINTKISIVGRALIQIGTAFERYGNGENSGSSPKAINNLNVESSIDKRIGSSTEAAPATFDIDTNLDARFNPDDDIKPNGSKSNGKKVKITTKTTTTTESSVVDEDDMISNDTDMDEKENNADKDNADGGDEMDIKVEADEKDSKDDGEINTNNDEALKIDLFKLNDGSSDNGFKLEESSDMKQVSTDLSSDDDLEKNVSDDEKNIEESESTDNEKLENPDTTNGSGDEAELSENSDNVNFIANGNSGKNDSNEGSGNLASGSQANSPVGYNYEGGKDAPPREYKYTAPNAISPGYQYSRPTSILPSYTYQSVPNPQLGNNYQGLNFNPPGYNYQPNIQPNGYKYEQPIITTTSTLGYNYVQAGSPSSGIKMNRIRSTTSGYHYPKPQTAISGAFAEVVPAQPSIYYNNRQPSSNNDFNYRSSVLTNQSPSNALQFQNSGIVNPSQIVNNAKLNNAFNYQTTSNVNTGVPTFNPAPNFNTNIGNLNSNLGTTSSIPSSFGNNYNNNAANFNSRPAGVTTSNSANTVASTIINQRPNNVVQSQQSVQYSQSPNINFNQFNTPDNTNRPSYSGNFNQRSSPQSSGFLTNSILGASISTLLANRPTSTIISSASNVNQNSANLSPARPSFAGNIRPTSNIINSTPNVNQNSANLSPARPSFAGNNRPTSNIINSTPNVNQNSANLTPAGSSFAGNIRPTSNIINSTPNVNQNSANLSPARPSFAGNIRPTSNIINSTPNVNQNSANLNPARPSFAGNKNIGQDLVQRQGNVASVNNNKKVEKPEIDHFAIIPSLVHPSSNKNINSNVQTQQSQRQQGGSFTTSPNFNFNLNSAFRNSISGNNNNNNQQQQQTFRIDSSPNLSSNSNFFSSPGSLNTNSFKSNFNNQSPTSGQQINLNINRNPNNGFLSSGIQNQNGRLSSSDSTLRLTGTGYNAGNGGGISQGQTNQYQQNSGNTQGNINPSILQNKTTNDYDEVTNSSINTLSALKNLTESEYYENGVKKLQYPNDNDEDVAFRAASDSLFVGDIRRYKKQSNPIQYNQQREYLVQ